MGVVVVGASLAGVRCVETLRREGFAGSITLLGEEKRAPYDRPPLSKDLLLGRVEPGALQLWDGSAEAELRLGVRAVGLDLDGQRVRLDDGSELPFDDLVVATGSAARTLPGTSLGNVFVLRTLDDAVALRAALAGARRVVVVGAGFVGLEVASSCRARGLAVTVVEASSEPLARVLPESLGRRIGALAVAAGVELACGVGVSAVEGGTTVERVVLDDGRVLPADVVVVAIGATPSVEWLEGSGLTLDDGVVCDARCVAAEHVVAAGDVARWWHAALGRSIRIEHWTNAVEQGRAAARAVVHRGAASPYLPVPYFWSDQFGSKIQQSGSIASADVLTVVEEDAEMGRFVAVSERDGVLTGAFAINRPAHAMRLMRQMKDEWAAPAAA